MLETETEMLTTENGSVNEVKKEVVSTRTYTAVDLIKSKRLFFTSMIMWFAWYILPPSEYFVLIF